MQGEPSDLRNWGIMPVEQSRVYREQASADQRIAGALAALVMADQLLLLNLIRLLIPVLA